MNSTLSRKRIIYVIRLVVAIVLAYFILLSPADTIPYAGYAFIAFYLATCLLVFYIPERHFYDGRLFYAFALFDGLMIGVGIYLSGMAGTDLYLIYFFIICLAAMGAQFRYLMISVVVFSGIYGFILYNQGYLAGGEAAGYLLRLPFIVVIAMFFGFLASITAHDSKNRLRETERQYRMLFDHSELFVFTVNREGEFLSANPKLYMHHGFSNEIEILGMPFAALHNEKEAEAFMEHLNTVFQTGAGVEYESYSGQAQEWFTHSLSPIKDPEKGDVFAVGGVSKNISERVRKETELQKAYDILRETREQLIQKDKMASLGRLASGIAHEIRNPMEIILMGIDYLEASMPEDNPSGRKSIDRIYNAVNRVNNIINDILKFSRKTAFVIEAVDVCEVINDAMKLTAHHMSKNRIHVEKHFPDQGIVAGANRNMLEQVILNIINNGVDAMEDVSVKEMTVSVYEAAVKDVGYKTGYRQTDYFKVGESMIIIEITDTGKGMDEDISRKIFEPFFTTKETGKGTGLGLSLAHMIIDRMKGTIDVESSPGKGTSFFVKLQPAANMEHNIKDETDAFEKKGVDY
ncbi:MAG: ATP-binding protein [Desulfosalsimonadaceae bacterium]